MKLYVERENKHRKLKFSGTVSQLLQKLKLNPTAVLVARNNELVAESDKLSDKDDIKILSVISGG
jgi:sulfur carrier protein ThiS